MRILVLVVIGKIATKAILDGSFFYLLINFKKEDLIFFLINM